MNAPIRLLDQPAQDEEHRQAQTLLKAQTVEPSVIAQKRVWRRLEAPAGHFRGWVRWLPAAAMGCLGLGLWFGNSFFSPQVASAPAALAPLAPSGVTWEGPARLVWVGSDYLRWEGGDLVLEAARPLTLEVSGVPLHLAPFTRLSLSSPDKLQVMAGQVRYPDGRVVGPKTSDAPKVVQKATEAPMDGVLELPARRAAFDAEAIYRDARGQTDPERAVFLFDQVTRHGGPLAEISAHQAVARRMAQGRWAEAEKRLQRLILQFPEGSLRQEADLDRVECALRQGALGRATEHLEAFSRRYPERAASAELRFVRGELARRRGDCSGALADLNAAQSSRHAEEASYLEAWCLHELGRPEAKTAWARYLERYPEGQHAKEVRALFF